MKKASPKPAAFTLIEVAISVGITTFCLVTMLGLLPVGLMSNQTSIKQTVANDILSQVTADLRATPCSSGSAGVSGTSSQFSIRIPANPVNSGTATSLYFTGDGQSSVSMSGSSRYLLTVTFQPNPQAASVSPDRAATLVNLQVTWPAAATAANAQGSVEKFVALNRN